MANLGKIVDKIVGGDLTESDLNVIDAATRTRRQQLRRQRADTLVSGARCRLTNIKPKYLTGVTGILETRNGSKWTFRPDPDQHLGRYTSPTLTVPDTALEPLEVG
jgi:hypothetical protein